MRRALAHDHNHSCWGRGRQDQPRSRRKQQPEIGNAARCNPSLSDITYARRRAAYEACGPQSRRQRAGSPEVRRCTLWHWQRGRRPQASPGRGTRSLRRYATKNRERGPHAERYAKRASRHPGLPLWQGILPAHHQQDNLRDASDHAADRYGNLAPSLRARERRQVRGVAENTHRACRSEPVRKFPRRPQRDMFPRP